MLASIQVVISFIGILTKAPGVGTVLVKGITLEPLQSKSNYLSHRGIGMWKTSFNEVIVCSIS